MNITQYPILIGHNSAFYLSDKGSFVKFGNKEELVDYTAKKGIKTILSGLNDKSTIHQIPECSFITKTRIIDHDNYVEHNDSYQEEYIKIIEDTKKAIADKTGKKNSNKSLSYTENPIPETSLSYALENSTVIETIVKNNSASQPEENLDKPKEEESPIPTVNNDDSVDMNTSDVDNVSNSGENIVSESIDSSDDVDNSESIVNCDSNDSDSNIDNDVILANYQDTTVYYFIDTYFSPSGYDKKVNTFYHERNLRFGMVYNSIPMFFANLSDLTKSLKNNAPSTTVVLYDNLNVLKSLYTHVDFNIIHIAKYPSDKFGTESCFEFYNNNSEIPIPIKVQKKMVNDSMNFHSILKGSFSNLTKISTLENHSVNLGSGDFIDCNIRMFVDASYVKNTKQSGYGIVTITDDDRLLKFSGSFKMGCFMNNNQSELAALYQAIGKADFGTIIYTDSLNAIQTIHRSMKQGTVNKSINRILNGEVMVRWVKGHNGNHYNEMVDELAKIGRSNSNN